MTIYKADEQAADRILRAAVRHSISDLRAGAGHAAVARTLEVAGEAAAMLLEPVR